MTTLEEVLADLETESERLDRLVAGLEQQEWRTPTPAPGWDVAHQVAHLAWTDETAVQAATDEAAWDASVRAALADPDGFVDAAAATGARLPPEQLLERWRLARRLLARTLAERPPGARIPWYGPPMSATSMATARFMETWAHSLDVHQALGAPHEVDDRIRHVVHLGHRTRDFAFLQRGIEPPRDDIRLELTAPSGVTWRHGSEAATQLVRGTAYHFCLLVTQRRHRADLDLVATGPDADRWLDVAQAFAGPPGAGREPRGAA